MYTEVVRYTSHQPTSPCEVGFGRAVSIDLCAVLSGRARRKAGKVRVDQTGKQSLLGLHETVSRNAGRLVTHQSKRLPVVVRSSDSHERH